MTAFDPEFIQYAKVRSEEWDGNEDGVEWQVHYVLYQTRDDDGQRCFDLYSDDGSGNGDMIARGYHESAMRGLVLRLGEFVEWSHPDDKPKARDYSDTLERYQLDRNSGMED